MTSDRIFLVASVFYKALDRPYTSTASHFFVFVFCSCFLVFFRDATAVVAVVATHVAMPPLYRQHLTGKACHNSANPAPYSGGVS